MGSTRGERRKGRGGSGAGLMDAWWRGRGIGVGVRATRHPEVKDVSCTAARGLRTCGWGSPDGECGIRRALNAGEGSGEVTDRRCAVQGQQQILVAVGAAEGDFELHDPVLSS